MSDSKYAPPKVWIWDKENGGKFASTNRPTAGAQTKVELPRGEHPLQLHSLATPNGVKVTVISIGIGNLLCVATADSVDESPRQFFV